MRNARTSVGLASLMAAALAMVVWANETATPVAQEVPVVTEVDEAPTGPHVTQAMRATAAAKAKKKDDLPKFDPDADGYKKVVSTADGARSLYTLYTRKKDAQMMAELPRSFGSQKLFIAYTIAGGTPTSGVQSGDMYATWKRFDKRLALVQPNYMVRSSGDHESKKGRDRVFTDRVVLDVPIAATGPGGGPMIDMDALLLANSGNFFGYAAAGLNLRLAEIVEAKAFPKNVEIAYKVPLQNGRFGTLHYSISVLPASTGYKARVADTRVGYFTTTHRDVGHPHRDTPWVRNINRWKLEKADPKLTMSPPKEPIVFYLEHTTPVRYRRWVRDGVLEWNKAFEKCGIINAIVVYQQDARTGTHMDKDPEDARYNFVLWTNAGMGFAIGPSRVDPRTGQIIDADIVMDEGFITSWVNAWRDIVPNTAMQNFTPQTLAWLQTRPQWDPRVRLAPPAERPSRIAALRQLSPHAGHPAGHVDATLMGDDAYDGLAGRISQVNGRCEYTRMASLELALYRLDPTILSDLARRGDDDDDEGDDDDDDDEGDDDDDDEDEGNDDDEQLLDGVPEWFVGPLLKGIVMHEVGHTLGLRHNFKASTAYSLAEMNSHAMKGEPITGSVMDYNPVNINVEDGETQGEYTMVTIGPYDYWAIEYGYTFDRDLKPILKRVAEPELVFGTDEDSWGSDPMTRVFDLGSDPLDYAESQMRLVNQLREDILERMVKDGDSWARARRGYELLLSRHMGAVTRATSWIGGSHSHRARKGDPDAGRPVVAASAEQQRRALAFVIDNAFEDDAFGLTPDLLAHMSVDKWWDDGGFRSIFEDPAYPIHERVLGIQAAIMTQLMNPTTLSRVFDNEFRVAGDDEVLALPELLDEIRDAVWSEVETPSSKRFTSREPMISSLRRNLQREHLERLIDLSLPNGSFGAASKPVANLSTQQLRDLQESIEGILKRRSKLDTYTRAHLGEAQMRIVKALDALYIYNTDDMGAGGGMPFLFFGEPTE